MSAAEVAPAVRRLLVHADDFGWSRSVNRGIIAGHADGIITHTGIIATAPAFEEGVKLLRATPTIGVGVHLQFYRGATLLPPERVSSLLRADGRLPGDWREIVRRLVLGRLDLGELEAELRAQIERVLEAGLTPVQLDSEKHLHLWPGAFDVVVRLAREFGVGRVRVVREWPSTRVIPAGLSALSARNGRVAAAAGIATVDGTIGVGTAPETADAMRRILGDARGGLVELIVHPGYIDDEFRAMQATIENRLVDSRERQLAVLTDPATRQVLGEFGFALAEEPPRRQ